MNNIQESGEMYLETILLLTKQNQNVKAIDVANALGYSKPSVSRGLKILKERCLIEIDEHNNLFLTSDGLKRAENILNKHNTLAKVFIKMGVDEEIAFQDACRIEHVISDDTFKAIKKYFNV